MKVQHWGGRKLRFTREARILARLQHPTIVSLFDAGTLPDGRRWFTMPEVHGQTLGELIDEVHEASVGAWRSTSSGWNLARLVGVLEEVAQAIAYAHDQGIVHRDLHPGNVMVGRFGQVQVVDWGIALELDRRESPDEVDLGDASLEKDTGTRHGTRLGTPAYMSPEQARGAVEAHGPHTDVYALGALLDTILTGGPPYPAGARAWRAVLRGPPEPLARRTPPDHPALPDELVRLASDAMCRAGADRPTAESFARSLRDWLDGTAARARAKARLVEADDLLAQLEHTQARALELETRARSHLDALPAGACIDDKRPAWRLRSEVEALRITGARLQAEALGALHGALNEVPDLIGAHRRLAAHYRARAEAAEARGDNASLAHHTQLLRQHDRGEHAEWLAGEGRIFLDSQPTDLRVRARRLQARDLRLMPGEPIELGRTPLVDRALAHGPWLLEIGEHDGSVLLPVHIERMTTWRLRPPGAQADHRVQAHATAEHECLVPAGWFVAGGDAEALDALPRRTLWLDAFIIDRDPVTVREYLDFLDDVHERDGAEQVLPLLPSWRPSAQAAPVHLATRNDGHYCIEELDGMAPWSDAHPIVFVSWRAATAYAAWRAERDELPWRLPHELEWAKAARGVDGRAYPWGNGFDPAFCWMKESAAKVISQQGVGAAPLDVSPYGVRGMGGNVRDWCSSAFTTAPPPDRSRVLTNSDEGGPGDGYRMIRGGSWTSSASNCRCAQRMAAKPKYSSVNVGFRLARSTT